MIHTWYLSADFQYYIISFFLLKIITIDVRIGSIASLGLTFLGVVIPAFINYSNKLSPVILYEADIGFVLSLD